MRILTHRNTDLGIKEMAIVHKILKGGAFVCGDTESGITSYAYPTSPSADLARKLPVAVATDMMRREHETLKFTLGTRADYDARNWDQLNA
jgi:hypothetical protein